MIKYCVEKWNKNNGKLKEEIIKINDKMNDMSYKDIVSLTVQQVFNDGDNEKYGFWSDEWNINKITEIDNGDYQGTILYMIPTDTYQPSESDYLLTTVGYGSCSGCDTLQSIQYSNWGDDQSLTSEQISGYMTLCKDIIQNTIKPYNYGWRNNEWFNAIEEE